MKLRRPSPALVISCVALAVACTGTAVAATVITSSGQIKNGAVSGADIRNGTNPAQRLQQANGELQRAFAKYK